jgi:chorismate synthase
VAAGAIARTFLARFGIAITSHVTRIGAAHLPEDAAISFDRVVRLAATDDVRCVDETVADAMRQAVDRAREAGDTVGGTFEVIAHQVPAGLGSYVQWDRKLDGRLGQAILSIPAIKAMGFGLAEAVGRLPGSAVHDEIVPAGATPTGTIPGLSRPTNRAGGLEGGVTNGEDLRITVSMKPISTLMKPLRSVDLTSMTEAKAVIERSDVCAVPAAAVVGEAAVAWVLAEAFLERFGGDSVGAIDAAWSAWTASLARRASVSGPI